MVAVSFESMKMALSLFDNYDEKVIMHIEEMEEEVDRYEDHLGTYLVKLSGSSNLSESDGHEITKMLRVIGDVERISDHAVDVVKSMRYLGARVIFNTHMHELARSLTNRGRTGEDGGDKGMVDIVEKQLRGLNFDAVMKPVIRTLRREIFPVRVGILRLKGYRNVALGL